MSITTKNWTATIDRMPGAASFRARGTVTVPSLGVSPKLVLSPLQDKSFDLRLNLELETAGCLSGQALTDIDVEYKVLGDSNVSGVSIFFEGELIHHIKEINITH